MTIAEIPNASVQGMASMASRVLDLWTRYRKIFLRVALALLAIMAAKTMVWQFHRLLFASDASGAIDLRNLHDDVRYWFAGVDVYRASTRAIYPPATQVILWPLLGWLSFTSARWLWAATSVLSLLWLVTIMLRESGATGRAERALLVLAVLSMNAVGVCIGNGQLIVHLLPLLTALLLVARSERSWWRDVTASAGFLVALAKPSIAAPFFWLLLFIPRRVNATLGAVAGYAVLTIGAAAFQSVGLATLLTECLDSGITELGNGYGHLPLLLHALGVGEWGLVASLTVLGALGVWTYVHRHADLWMLLGVTAIVARVWTYHRVYDDTLLLLPAIALFRLAKSPVGSTVQRVGAGALFAVLVATSSAPGRLHDHQPWSTVVEPIYVSTWLLALAFLLWYTHNINGTGSASRRRAAF